MTIGFIILQNRDGGNGKGKQPVAFFEVSKVTSSF
ncbi:uncharacterized protein G2W53_020366 [Senna tora]|uniref:Uncharacterized protein n=1 Tax=Senna tora TaxID=362788 RepID=A0A834TW83_9FABA|nr:uncharacterized protein G2W53_020366 [Senna tora]